MNKSQIESNDIWDIVIIPNNKLLDLNLSETWKYRDLLFLLVRRDFVSFYKQTIFGPIWFFIQPLFTAVTFMFVFGNLAGISTDNIPAPLFYLSGILIWTFFSETLVKTSTVLRDNSNILGKVYFPRIIMPLSIVASSLLKYSIQLVLFLGLYIFYCLNSNDNMLSIKLVILPLIICLFAVQSLGFGLIISGLTTKYRDLALLVTFGIQLLLYISPIAYPISSLSATSYFYMKFNPLSYLFDLYRECFFNVGGAIFENICIASIQSFFVLIIGILVFNKVEKSFIDTI
jgi:lipopolysaccharide transport system permease protein